MSVHHPIGAGDEDEITRQGTCGGGAGADTLDRFVERIGAVVGQGGVLNGDPGKAHFAGQAHGFSDILGGVAKAVLKVARNRNRDGGHQIAGMGQGLVPRDISAVGQTKGEGMGGG